MKPPKCYVPGCENPGRYSDRNTPWACARHYLLGTGASFTSGVLDFIKEAPRA